MVLEELVASLKTGMQYEHPVELGRGKSAIVFLVYEGERKVARKVFTGHPAADFFNTFSMGSPTPYRTIEDAAWTAYYRRQVLSVLYEYHFGDNLKIARPVAPIVWNDEYKALQMDTELVEGRHAALDTPFSVNNDLDELFNDIINPLKEFRKEIGFDIWQVDNLSSIGNFLKQETETGHVWWQIDDESGGSTFPYQFFINPVSFLNHYLPKTIRLKRPAFDDVDMKKLREYISKNAEGIEEKVGNDEFISLLHNIEMLGEHQKRWKEIGRVECAIRYAFETGKIDQETADFYRKHQGRMYAIMMGAMGMKLGEKAVELSSAGLKAAIHFDYKKAAGKAFKLVTSTEYRTRKVREHIDKRITHSEQNSLFTEEQGALLRKQIGNENATHFISNFGGHFALKPIDYLQKAIIPALYATGYASGEVLLTSQTIGGSILRGAYSLTKMIFDLGLIGVITSPITFYKFAEDVYLHMYVGGLGEGMKHVKRCALDMPHLTAFFTGIIPTVGNFAYPIEGIYSSSTKETKQLLQFIVQDGLTEIGSRIPIYGGKNTTTQHFLNRLSDFDRIAYDSNLWNNAEAAMRIAFAFYM